MTFQEAFEKLCAIAGERYCALEMEACRHSLRGSPPKVTARARVYIDGPGHSEYATSFEQVLVLARGLVTGGANTLVAEIGLLPPTRDVPPETPLGEQIDGGAEETF